MMRRVQRPGYCVSSWFHEYRFRCCSLTLSSRAYAAAANTVGTQKDVLDNTFNYFQLQKLEDWYSVRSDQLKKAPTGVWSMISSKHDGCLHNALQFVFPDHRWLAWRFKRVPLGWWQSLDNQRQFWSWLVRDILHEDPTKVDSYYSITRPLVIAHGGRSLVYKYYGGCVFSAISTAYPDLGLLAWNFGRQVPKGFWNSLANQRLYLDWYARTHNMNDLNAWYSVDVKDVSTSLLLLRRYRNSLPRLLQAVYPEHGWLHWKFQQAKKADVFIRHPEQQRLHLEWVAGRLRLTSFEDWYNITNNKYIEAGGDPTLLNSIYSGNLQSALLVNFPHHNWVLPRFSRPTE